MPARMPAPSEDARGEPGEPRERRPRRRAAAQRARSAGVENEALRDVVAGGDEKLTRRVGAVLADPRKLADDTPMLVERSRQRGGGEELRAARSCLGGAESRRCRVQVGVP